MVAIHDENLSYIQNKFGVWLAVWERRSMMNISKNFYCLLNYIHYNVRYHLEFI